MNTSNRKKFALWGVALAVFICALGAVYLLARPSGGDCFAFTSSDGEHFTYELHLGTEIAGGTLYAEQWVKGVCVRSSPVAIAQEDDTLELILRERREDGASIGTEIQLQSRPHGGSLLTYFAHPEGTDILGWASKGYESGERHALATGDEVIFAAKVFDTGSGVRVFDCETLIAEPERLENAEYMLVIRAVFD